MSRMNNAEVAHHWAHNISQAESHTGNLFVCGDVIYSYGFHAPLARRVNSDVFLVTSITYSPTTSSRHMPPIRRAIPLHARVFYVPMVRANSETEHRFNFEALSAEYADLLGKASRARVHGATYLADAVDIGDKANQYAEIFGLSERLDTSESHASELVAIVEAARQKERERQQRAAEEAERRAADTIARWEAGELVHVPYSVKRVYLRVRDGQVETSKSARIPIGDARRLWTLVCSYRSSAPSEPYRVPLRLGQYQLSRIEPNGDIIAGCHHIEYAEASKVAAILGFDQPADIYR